jgi:hypothetical protein
LPLLDFAGENVVESPYCLDDQSLPSTRWVQHCGPLLSYFP